MEQTFKRFLMSFVSAGHTYDDIAMDELDNLTNQFLNWLDPCYFFTINATSAYVEFLDDKMSETNRHYFNFRFKVCKYVDHLEKWIRHLLD